MPSTKVSVSRSKSETEIKLTTDMKEDHHRKIISSIVEKMYRSGSSNRSQKQGSPNVLIEKVMKNKKSNKITTIGLFSKVDKKYRENLKDLTPEDKVGLIKFILKLKNTYSEDYYCYIPVRYEIMLTDYVDGKNNKELRNIFTSIFIHQERQKVESCFH
jgi:hypothetical protein